MWKISFIVNVYWFILVLIIKDVGNMVVPPGYIIFN